MKPADDSLPPPALLPPCHSSSLSLLSIPLFRIVVVVVVVVAVKAEIANGELRNVFVSLGFAKAAAENP